MSSAQDAADAEFDKYMNGAWEAPVTEQAIDVPNRKRKVAQDDDAAKKQKTVQENRAIYVTNLPRDTNEVELEAVFSRYGIIDQGADGNKRIKMYADDEGNFNGEALIVYFKSDSIDLAVKMLDDYWFRIEEQNNGTISVKEADFSYKRNKDSEQVVSKLTRQDKKASERNRADLNRKLAEWSDNEDEVKEAYAPKKNKWAKICIVKNAFTLKELDEDAAAYLEIKEDMREQGEKYGDVTNVTLYDKEPEGIVSVRFKEFEAAEQFRDVCHGKSFAYRRLEVTIAENKPRFRKSRRGEEEDSSDEDRLERATRA
ncbi:hypothetical protein BDU57DRAFT_260653 [Ampelomyces quisqualis]|uniref:RRM domain-containing protein n=1 Tax=Ampelomyces quisqualis TaxID=50730 RepID=A0A6A5QJN0_AMPQU|nr:hypothetical protein BDU57DRAFT_260653 [Ampelomyces quisqualis]